MTSSQYQDLAILDVRNAVLSISFSAQAKFVAATGKSLSVMHYEVFFLKISSLGYSGIAIWDLSGELPVQVSVPQFPYVPQVPGNVITTSTWLYFTKTSRHVLALGSLAGDSILWQWDQGENVHMICLQHHALTPDLHVRLFSISTAFLLLIVTKCYHLKCISKRSH